MIPFNPQIHKKFIRRNEAYITHFRHIFPLIHKYLKYIAINIFLAQLCIISHKENSASPL